MSKEFLVKLREANQDRQKLWDPENVISGNLGILFRSNELGGELGEALNEVKKYVREQMNIKGSRTTKEEIEDELADILICLDLLSQMLDIDLIKAVTKKFNQTSDNIGFDVKL